MVSFQTCLMLDWGASYQCLCLKFLENRQFKVRIGSTLSDLHDQEMGVPQSSILSVTLFGLKINNIVNCLRPGTQGSLYVDDFLACCRSKQMRSIERQLQQVLNNLQKWADENGFKFSKTKTVCMHFASSPYTQWTFTAYRQYQYPCCTGNKVSRPNIW